MRPLVPLAVVLLLASCGTPPELRERGGTLPIPSASEHTETPVYPPGYSPRPSTPPSPTASPSPSRTQFPDYSAVDCAGQVKASQVISAVKANTTIEPTKALVGPLCAGTWQYTLLEVPGADPVQVVTRDDVKFVVAGTEVCTAEVRLYAPSGIKTAAEC